MKPRMKNHFRAHQLSVWLRLIPELHRAGMEDVMLRHNLFRNHEDADLYEGVVRPDPLSRRQPQRATINRFTANGTVAEVVQSLTTTGRPQWPSEVATTCLPTVRGPNASNSSSSSSSSSSAEDALATLGAAGYAAYSTALHVTIALGVSLLVLNGLLLVIICYQKDRFKCLQHQQVVNGNGGQELSDHTTQKSARYKASAISDDRIQQQSGDEKMSAGYDHHHHHHLHHHQQQTAVDAVAVDMEQRHHHHVGHQHHPHHGHVPIGVSSPQIISGGGTRMSIGHDMTFPKAAKPSSRQLHEHLGGGSSGNGNSNGPPNGSVLHGTLPKPPPPPRSAIMQSQESQPLLVQQSIGLNQISKTGTLKMPVAAMSEMRV